MSKATSPVPDQSPSSELDTPHWLPYVEEPRWGFEFWASFIEDTEGER